MTQPQQGALAAITAALSSKQTQPAAPMPMAFTFVPQGTPPAQPLTFGAPLPSSNPFAPAPQPTPVQAAAAFVAAVPRAAEQHAHPVTGVPFAPINPPGEASSAPTVGLDAAPVPSVQVAVSPEAVDQVLAAPKARARKPRAAAQSLETVVVNNTIAQPAGDGAVESVEACAPDFNPDQFLYSLATEVLVKVLNTRGFKVTLRS